jgi:hypothetical protein
MVTRASSKDHNNKDPSSADHMPVIEYSSGVKVALFADT